MQVEHDEKKREYDTLQLQLESSMARLEVEVKQYQEEIMGESLGCQIIETHLHLVHIKYYIITNLSCKS